jgi:hypothetical protein
MKLGSGTVTEPGSRGDVVRLPHHFPPAPVAAQLQAQPLSVNVAKTLRLALIVPFALWILPPTLDLVRQFADPLWIQSILTLAILLTLHEAASVLAARIWEQGVLKRAGRW